MKVFFPLVITISLLAASCADDSDPDIVPGNEDSLIISDAFPLLSFNRPVDLQNNGDNNLFVVEQRGVIRVFLNDPATDNAAIFLDIQSIVDDRDNEEGLLGLAFHPDFSQNGYFYVNYTTPRSTTVVSRFETDPTDPLTALPASELPLLEFAQLFGNHNGGQLTFGPDGYLYIAVGDGGSGGDPQGNGQNTATLLGSILRVDVDNPDTGLNYGIPVDNPFSGNQTGAREEIFAYGLRNPWRMSFDSQTGQLWVGDVGQNQFEEISIVENGGNYGWKIMEADNCFGTNNCDQDGLTAPYFGYNHSNGDGSITGGYIYRGGVSMLAGKYIYADYTSGRIWALETSGANPHNELLFDTSHRITSFGVDSQQELYFCTINGKIFRVSAE